MPDSNCVFPFWAGLGNNGKSYSECTTAWGGHLETGSSEPVKPWCATTANFYTYNGNKKWEYCPDENALVCEKTCDGVTCGDNQTCDAGVCKCDTGFVATG